MYVKFHIHTHVYVKTERMKSWREKHKLFRFKSQYSHNKLQKQKKMPKTTSRRQKNPTNATTRHGDVATSNKRQKVSNNARHQNEETGKTQEDGT